jgi:hypothetical protein
MKQTDPAVTADQAVRADPAVAVAELPLRICIKC